MESIAEEHSEIRLSAFQLVDELFQRSHFFRQLLTVDFQRLVTLGKLVVRTHTHEYSIMNEFCDVFRTQSVALIHTAHSLRHVQQQPS